jgi:hypothetical protein
MKTAMTFGGMLFQVMMVRGKKEKRYTSARVYIVLKAAIPLVLKTMRISEVAPAKKHCPDRERVLKKMTVLVTDG